MSCAVCTAFSFETCNVHDVFKAQTLVRGNLQKGESFWSESGAMKMMDTTPDLKGL
jgi:hypothetical protein